MEKFIKINKNVINKYNQIPIQAKLALWLTFCTLIQKGISVITVPFFTRVMDVVEYGKISVYFSWLDVFSIICSFKLGAGVYNKGLSKYKDDQDGYCLTMQYTTSIITILVYVVYFLFRKPINSFTEMNTVITSLMFVEIFFSTSMGFWSVKRQYSFKYKAVVVATLFYALLNPVLGILMVLNTNAKDRATARIISVVISQVVVGFFFYILNMKSGQFRLKKEYSLFALRFNIVLIPHYFSEYILNQSDRIMIQKTCSYMQVAFYGVAYNAAMLLTIITGSINQAITPWLYQNLDEKNFNQIGKVLITLTSVLLIPIVVFIAFAPEAIYILAGSDYISAAYVIPPVAGSVIFLFLYTNFANIEFYYDFNKFTMYISLIGAIVNIILNYVLIPVFGYVAAGYTTFFCYFIYCIGHYIFVERILKRKYGQGLINWKQLLLLFLFLAVVMIFMSFMYQYFVIRYIIIIVSLMFVVVNRKYVLAVVKEIRNKPF